MGISIRASQYEQIKEATECFTVLGKLDLVLGLQNETNPKKSLKPNHHEQI